MDDSRNCSELFFSVSDAMWSRQYVHRLVTAFVSVFMDCFMPINSKMCLVLCIFHDFAGGIAIISAIV